MAAEANLQRRLMRWCKARNIYCEKRHGSMYGRRGTADLYLLVRVDWQPYSVPLHLELKAPGRTPTPLQQRRAYELTQAGAATGWADTFEKAVAIIEHLQQEQNRGDGPLD